jgi:hypothetical protein
MAQVYGAYVWAYLVLLAALVVLLRQKEGYAAEADAEPLASPAGEPWPALEVVHQRVSYCADPADRITGPRALRPPGRLPT